MKVKLIRRIALLALGAALLQPNASQAEGSQAKLAASIGEIRTETIHTRDQLQATMDALNALTKQKKGDLKPTYDAFTAEVQRTHAAADLTASRTGAMQNASKEYFGGWQEEVGGIANESLRKKAQKRLEAVRKNYDEAIVSLREASEKFKPFLSNLDDVQKTLANDITPGGVKSIRSVASDANFNMKKVRSSIFEAIKELDNMEKSLSSHANG